MSASAAGSATPPRKSPGFFAQLGTALRPSPAIAYVLRTLLAMGIAFHSALWLQLDSPASSVVTVMIVASLSRGAILSKGFWRIFGTFMGATAAVIITAWFGQTPLLFLVAFGLWLGLCTFASSMFRHFRAYGAVLAGYTVALISTGALVHPDEVLHFALARLAVVTLGVVVSMAVTMIFQPGVTTHGMRLRARMAFRGVAQLLLQRAEGTAMDDPAFVAERTRLASEIERLDEAVEFSGAEAPDVQRHAASIRRGLASLFAALLSVSVAGGSLNRLTMAARPHPDEEASPEPDQSIATEVQTLLHDVSLYEVRDRHSAAEMAERIARVAQNLTRVQGERHSLDQVTTLARVHQELVQLNQSITPFAAWQEGKRPPYRGGPLVTFKDYATALRNGVRAAIAVMIGGLFVSFTAWWPAGPTTLIVLGASCGLLSNSPSAAAAAGAFAKGITLSTLAAFVYGFLILPHLSGFATMFLSLMPVLAIAIYCTTIPRYALLSLAFVIFFITQINFANQMNYNIEVFTNTSITFFGGAWATFLAFRVVWPPNAMRDAANLTWRIRRSTERVIRGRQWHRGQRDWLGWLVTYNQALQRLFLRLAGNPALRNQTIGDSGALLIIAQEALRLRAILKGLDLPPAERAQAETALAHLGRLRRPGRAAASAQAASEALEALNAASDRRRPGLLRAAGCFRTIAALMPQAQRMLAIEAPFPKDA